jgi:hypothetical protein
LSRQSSTSAQKVRIPMSQLSHSPQPLLVKKAGCAKNRQRFLYKDPLQQCI